MGGIHPNPGPSADCLVRFGSLNVRSAIHKAAAIHSLIADEQLQILALNETWASLDDPPAILQDIAPAGFQILHTPRPQSTTGHRGGGLALLISDGMTARVQQTMSPTTTTTFEVQCIRVTVSRFSFIITNVYRPSSTAPSTAFYNELSDYVSAVCSNNSVPVLLCGDFNCPGDNEKTVAVQLSDILDALNFTNEVSQATRNNNILDIIATNSSSFLLSTSVSSSHHISVHLLIISVLNINKPLPPATTRLYRPLSRINYDQLDDSLLLSALVTNPAVEVDDYVNQINRIVICELDRRAPIRVRCFVQRSLPCDEFLSAEAVMAKRDRRRLERVWRRTGNENARLEYRASCRAANKAINDSRANYLACKLRNISVNSARDKWKSYNGLLHRNSVHISHGLGENIANFCNSLALYFIEKISKIQLKNALSLAGTTINPLSHDSSFSNIPLSAFSNVTPDEVRKLLSSMCFKFSPLDAFPASIIKSCPKSFSLIISKLANLSFSKGYFPSQYKIAQITPLLKKPNLNPDDTANYRPISNLHTIGKILERLALARLQPHILSSGNFNPMQSAYRKFHSTETCLLKTFSDIYSAIDRGQSILLVALDLSAAFDTVPHDTLLQRLQYSFGINDSVLEWLRSYLSLRTQYVAISDHKSPLRACLLGCCKAPSSVLYFSPPTLLLYHQ